MKYAVLVCAAFAIASPAQVPDRILSGPRTAWPLDRVVRLDLPIHLFGGSAATLTIPSSASFVGATFAMQGVALGVHQCLGGLDFGDTIRFTIR